MAQGAWKTLARVVAQERGLFVGALILGGGALEFGVPMDFVLFGLTLAGVALSNLYPQAKSVGLWLRHGWHPDARHKAMQVTKPVAELQGGVSYREVALRRPKTGG